ncbi:MAG: O-antigen ligase family protein [Candidatus Doudnabacteria bacterium]
MIYFVGLILALLPAYLIRFRIFGLPTTLLELLIVVFLLVSVAFINRGSIKKIKSLGRLNWAIILFVLAGIISTAVSPQHSKALGELKAFIVEPVLFFYAVILVFKSNEQLKIPLRWLLIGAGVISLFGILQYFTYINLPLRFWGTGAEVERISSFFDYPNALALYLAPLFGYFFTLMISGYRLFKNRWIEWAGLALMGIGLLLTFSRGAWLALLASLGLLLWQKYGKKTLVPMILVIAVLLAFPAVRNRIALGFSDPSSQAHFDLMKIGADKIAASPILGNGLYGFRTTLQQSGFTGEILNYPHNIFLNFWLEMGLLGLIAFCDIIFLSWQKSKKRPEVLTLAASVFLLTMILQGLTDVPYFKNDLSILFWFMIAVAHI